MVDTKTKPSYFVIGLSRPRPPEYGITGLRKAKPKDPIDEFAARFELPRIHYKPSDAIDFFPDGSLDVPPNLGYTEVVGLRLPMGHEGVIKFIGMGADAPGLFVDCKWQLLLNGAPVRNWFDFSFQRGTLSEPMPVTIFMPTSSIVSLQIRNTAANHYTAKAQIIGWSWIVKDILYASMG